MCEYWVFNVELTLDSAMQNWIHLITAHILCNPFSEINDFLNLHFNLPTTDTWDNDSKEVWRLTRFPALDEAQTLILKGDLFS